MKQFIIIAFIATAVVGLASCGGAKGEDPGHAYMPDMYYSRAYEAYGYNNVERNYLDKEKGFNYTGLPVGGTMARGDGFYYPIPNTDSGYAMSATYRDPMDTLTLTAETRKEAERLYLVNCGICHGSKLDGNGPLWKGGDGPYPAAPRNLLDDYSKKLSDGTMYHVIVHGRNLMGSYAAQVKPQERWWIIKYIREKQGGGAAAATTDTTATAATAGSTAADTTKTTK